MTVGQLEELLHSISDKDMNVLVSVSGGFVSSCVADSGVVLDHSGEAVLVVMPCYCHLEPDEPIVLKVRSDDFDDLTLN